MRVLLIGGSGLVGPHVVRLLAAAENADVWAMSRSGRSPFCARTLQGDRNSVADLKRALSQARPHVVVDMIPFDIAGASALADAIAETAPNTPIVAVSSIDVYAAYGRLSGAETAPRQATPIDEESTLRSKLGPEGAEYDKIGVERVYRGRSTRVASMRLPAEYGWPDVSRIQDPLDAMLDGAETITVERRWAHWRFSRCLHKNAAHAIVLAARALVDERLDGFEAFNVAEETAYSTLDWNRRIAGACGWRGRFETTDGDGGDVDQDFVVSTAKIRERLGYAEIASPEDGLADAVAHHALRRFGRDYVKGY